MRSYERAPHAEVATRRGASNTKVAVTHAILDAALLLAISHTLYRHPGTERFKSRHNPQIEVTRRQSTSGTRASKSPSRLRQHGLSVLLKDFLPTALTLATSRVQQPLEVGDTSLPKRHGDKVRA